MKREISILEQMGADLFAMQLFSNFTLEEQKRLMRAENALFKVYSSISKRYDQAKLASWTKLGD
jgi:hypothetical protein